MRRGFILGESVYRYIELHLQNQSNFLIHEMAGDPVDLHRRAREFFGPPRHGPWHEEEFLDHLRERFEEYCRACDYLGVDRFRKRARRKSKPAKSDTKIQR